MGSMITIMRATRVLIHLDHLKHNIDQLRAHTGSRPLLCLAVKADAYGHGITQIGLAAADFGVEPGQALMVGDSVSDVKAARAAGTPIVCMTYGYNHGRDIREMEPDAVMDRLDELPALLDSGRLRFS